MKPIEEFLSYLCSLDIKLWADGNRLRCNAPKDKLTPALKAELAERKGEILEFLSNAGASNHTEKLIQPVSREGNLPLSFAQQRLWFIDQLEPGSFLYNLPAALHLKGVLNVAALSETLNEVVQRHEALRTAFGSVEGQPVQVITPALTVTLPIVDLQELPEDLRQAEVLRLITNEAQRPFNLSQAPLLRATLLRLSEVEHVLLFTMHHIVSDGWSMGVLIQEVAALYAAFSTGQPSPLPELPIQYADFAVWQRQYLQGEVLETQLAYWHKQLESARTVLQLPTDRPRPRVQTFRGATKSFSLSQNFTEALKALSRDEGVTLFMTLLAAFKTLLHRYTSQDDILVGSPIANRNRNELEGLIGFFVNTLVLRTNLSDNSSFRELLGRVREVTLGAYAHQDVPFEKLVEVLQPQRDLSYPPLFQVMFVLQNTPISAIELSGLTVSSLENNKNTAKFDLTLYMEETAEGMLGTLEYNTDLFEASTICRMVGHLQTLLAGIVTNPECPVQELPLLTASEQHQLVVEWNNTEIAYPQDVCIHHLFEEQVEKSPDAVAVVFEDQQLTYRELNNQANQLAHYLQQQGVKPESLVGICMERSLEMVIGLLSILKAGSAYVPLDPVYPQERLAFMLADTQVPVLLTQQHLEKILPPHQAQVISLDTNWETLARQSPENPVSKVTPGNSAYVIYTSGSTGRPKGVINTHKGICNRLLWMQDTYQLTPGDRVLQKTPFSFDVSVWEFFLPLLNGSGLVIARPSSHQDSAYLLKLIAQEQITILHFVPSMLQVFLEQPGLAASKSLKHVICSGEALPLKLQKRFFARLDAELHNLYGPTEAAIDVTFWHCQRHSGLQIVPIGRPIANTQIYLLDSQGQPVPIGIPGELHIGGLGVARGYLNRPELTAEKFIPNPFEKSKENRLYRTGDLARYLSDGNIEFLGRIDNQVKVRGFRIELGEIEAILTQHSAVQASVVTVREDEPHSQRLVAYVVPQSEQTVKITELRRCLNEKLPEYMVPSAFVFLNTLPLLPNGKLDRRALPAPDHNRPELETPLTTPRTPLEEVVTAIWLNVLDLEQVGIDDNFFEIGGHSLLATQVISRVHEAFQVELPLRCLFESPTVAEFSKSIETAIKAKTGLETQPIQPVARDRNLPLSFAQQRLWFLNQLAPDDTSYNIPTAVRLVGSLNVTALELSLNEIVRRHEVLRTTFATVNGEPIQVIAPTLTLTVPVVDLKELANTQREQEFQKLAIQEAEKPFNLSQCPLLRMTLVQLSEVEHVVLFTMHHIICDGWSMGVLIQEVAALYAAFSKGQPSPLPELSIQYADFAVWQRQYLQGEVRSTQLAYWKQQLGGTLPVLQLPYSPARTATGTSHCVIHTFRLSAQLSQALKKLSHQANATLFMTMLAALKTLLHRYTGQNDIVVGTDVANRNRAETEELIGFFVNLLVLRTDLGGYPSFWEVLKRVREIALAAYAHQDLPFEKLVEELQPERHLSHTPLFQVLFVMQNVPTSELKLPSLTLTPLDIKTKTAKFNLALFLSETEPEIIGSWHYNTDLFDVTTIERMTAHFETLLNSIVIQPDARINTLEMLTADEQKKQIMAEAKHEQGKLKKFTQVKPKAIKLPQGELIKTNYLQSGQTLPLVLEPAVNDIDISDWAKSNREYIETELLKHGTILFRGFNLDTVSAFENLAEAICPDLFGEYGDLPREGVSNKVYGSTPYPSDQAILFHNESSHMHCWPLKIWFFCVQPAQQGGETPIVDCRQVYQTLDPKLREIFEKKQLMYVRNYIEGLDVSWQDFFHTTDKQTVENYCYQAGIEFEWLENNGLRTKKLRPAVAVHPKTGEQVFFNQIQLHHVFCLNPTVRESLLSMFGEENLPRHVYYGDGSPIEDAVMAEINQVYGQATISFPWQQGDVLMLDNMLTAHGRFPYEGSRKIVVAMGEIIQA